MISEQQLRNFIESLREHGFEIGVDTHLQCMLLWKKVQPNTPAAVEKFKYQITPLLATNEDEQELCYHLYHSWFVVGTDKGPDGGPPPSSIADQSFTSTFFEVLLRDRKGRLRVRDLLLSLLVTLIVGGYFWCNAGDGDWIPQTFDNCPTIANFDQTDTDNDGMGDTCDLCPTLFNPKQLNNDGVAGDTVAANPYDIDGDSIGNGCDNCPDVFNPTQLNTDNDTLGNLCDNCRNTDNNNQADADEDGIGDVCDNCPNIANPNQYNVDGDSLGNACDPDIDGDGILNVNDSTPTIYDPEQLDSDGDGLHDVVDLCPDKVSSNNNDSDNDGVGDACDICPDVSNPGQNRTDRNNNGTWDECEEEVAVTTLFPPYAPNAPDLSELLYDPATDNFYANIKWALVVVLGLLFILFIWVEVNFRKRSKKWERDPGTGAFHYRVNANAKQVSVFTDEAFLELARMLKRRSEGEHKHFNIPKTIRNTNRSGGFVNWVFDPAMHASEYLVLIKRGQRDDHEAHFYRQLCLELSREQVHLSAYFYDESPQVCQEVISERTQELSDLIVIHPRHRLLVFGEAVDFFDPITGLLPKWHKHFEAWPERALFLREKPNNTDYFQAILKDHWLVLPALHESASFMIRHFWNEEDEWSISPNDLAEHLPDAPDAENLSALKTYLGQHLFQWLCALAVYPDIDWELTLQLGQHLQPDGSWHHSDQLHKLVRISWFKEGRIPKEWRLKLMEQLEEPYRTKTHRLLVGLLEDDKGKVDQHSYAYNQYALQSGTHHMAADPGRGKMHEDGQKWLKEIHPKLIAADEIAFQFVQEAQQPGWSKLVPGWLKKRWFYGGIPYLGWRAGVGWKQSGIMALLAVIVGLSSLGDPPPLTHYANEYLYLENEADSGLYYAALANDYFVAERIDSAIYFGNKAVQMDTITKYNRYALSLYYAKSQQYSEATTTLIPLAKAIFPEDINQFPGFYSPAELIENLATQITDADIGPIAYLWPYLLYHNNNYEEAQFTFNRMLYNNGYSALGCDSLGVMARVGNIAAALEKYLLNPEDIYSSSEQRILGADYRNSILDRINEGSAVSNCNAGTPAFVQLTVEAINKLDELYQHTISVFKESDNNALQNAYNRLGWNTINEWDPITPNQLPFKGKWAEELNPGIAITDEYFSYSNLKYNYEEAKVDITQRQHLGDTIEFRFVVRVNPGLLVVECLSVDGTGDELQLNVMSGNATMQQYSYSVTRITETSVPEVLQQTWYNEEGVEQLFITSNSINGQNIIALREGPDGHFRAMVRHPENNGFLIHWFREITVARVLHLLLNATEEAALDRPWSWGGMTFEQLNSKIENTKILVKGEIDASAAATNFVLAIEQIKVIWETQFLADVNTEFLAVDSDTALSGSTGNVVIRVASNNFGGEYMGNLSREALRGNWIHPNSGELINDFAPINNIEVVMEEDLGEYTMIIDWETEALLMDWQTVARELLSTMDQLPTEPLHPSVAIELNDVVKQLEGHPNAIKFFNHILSFLRDPDYDIETAEGLEDLTESLRGGTPLERDLVVFTHLFSGQIYESTNNYVQAYNAFDAARKEQANRPSTLMREQDVLKAITGVNNFHGLISKAAIQIRRMDLENGGYYASETTAEPAYHILKLDNKLGPLADDYRPNEGQNFPIQNKQLAFMLQPRQRLGQWITPDGVMRNPKGAWKLKDRDYLVIDGNNDLMSFPSLQTGPNVLIATNIDLIALSYDSRLFATYKANTRQVTIWSSDFEEISEFKVPGNEKVKSMKFDFSGNELLLATTGKGGSTLYFYVGRDSRWITLDRNVPRNIASATYVFPTEEILMVSNTGKVTLIDTMGNNPRDMDNYSPIYDIGSGKNDREYHLVTPTGIVSSDAVENVTSTFKFQEKARVGRALTEVRGAIVANGSTVYTYWRYNVSPGPRYELDLESVWGKPEFIHLSITPSGHFAMATSSEGHVYKIPVTEEGWERFLPLNDEAMLKVNTMLQQFDR